MAKDTWNIIWKGCTPGKIDEDEYGVFQIMDCSRGLKKLHSVKEIDDWITDMSVSFGEEGGSFNIRGGWRGSFKDLKEGREEFYTSKMITELLIGLEYERAGD